MSNANKTAARSIRQRIAVLEAEKNDEFCFRHPAARNEVDRALDAAWRELRRAEGREV